MKPLKGLSEHILASISDGIVVLDPACRVVTFNPAMEEMTGISSQRVAGAPLASVLPKEPSIPDRVIPTPDPGHPFITSKHQWMR